MKIRVNSVAPGAIRTPINAPAWNTPDSLASRLKLIPYGRIGEPEDVARAAMFFLSPDNGFVTGQMLYVCGGTTLGVVAGYFGGAVDRVVSFLITARLALPIILVALAVVSVGGASLTVVVLVLGLLLWERYALVARTMAAGLRNAEFVTASRLQGCTHLQIIWRDILPNLVGNLLIIGTVDAALAITLEASLRPWW
ncbi:hypothetical protein G6F63_014155 [Rhizopus arrhizus]|nr:hypothetical protein G6F63_014155 [Rhizopus arrhizus]